MTYENVNKMIKGHEGLIEKYHDLYPMILDMVALSDIIRARRESCGALDFEVTETKIVVDEKGEIVDGDKIIALISKKMLEEGRLNKNTVVVTQMSNLGLEKYLNNLDLSLIVKPLLINLLINSSSVNCSFLSSSSIVFLLINLI